MKTLTVNKKFLLFRCAERGYSLAEVMPCVVSQNGDDWTIDIEHENYPKESKIQIKDPNNGVGTELKKLLKLIGIKASETCPCNARAKIMNENGIQWCEQNKDTILGWLKEAATERNLPFSSFVATQIINLAIKRAKKNISK